MPGHRAAQGGSALAACQIDALAMTVEAFSYALGQVPVPQGRHLWLYGDPRLATGDVYQPHYQQAQQLQQKGCVVFSDIEEIGHAYDAVFLHCPQQQQEAEGLVALALERSRGMVMVAAANNAGGGRLAGMLESYRLTPGQLSKNKCRVVWSMEASLADRKRVADGVQQLQPRQIALEGESWWTVPGIFGWDKIDVGSRLLLEHVPADLFGNVADFGSGYGYLAASLLRRCPAITQLDAYEVDARAVACSRRNLGEKAVVHWLDVQGLAGKPTYHAVVMNPPFHSGKAEDSGLGQAFIRKGWESLMPRGQLYVVANRHLPYEKTVPGLALMAEGQGFKLLYARKP